MNRWLVSLLMLASSTVHIDESLGATDATTNKVCDKVTLIAAIVDPTVAAKSGCCSHHGGVCGCAGSRQKCCDGSLSPSCMCGEISAPLPDWWQ